MPTRKTEETATVPPLPPKTAEFFFLPFLAELDNSESFETNLFSLKKIPLVFEFDTCNFSKVFNFLLLLFYAKLKISCSEMIQECLTHRKIAIESNAKTKEFKKKK